MRIKSAATSITMAVALSALVATCIRFKNTPGTLMAAQVLINKKVYLISNNNYYGR